MHVMHSEVFKIGIIWIKNKSILLLLKITFFKTGLSIN